VRRLIGLLDGLTRVLHYVSGALIVGLMLMTVAHILGRWLFNTPFRGSVELTEIGMVAIVFLGLAYAQVQGDHIRVDLLYEKLGARLKTAARLFAELVTLAVVLLVGWQLVSYTDSLAASGRETSALGISLTWVGWIAVAGCVFFALGVAVTAVRGDAERQPADAQVGVDAPAGERQP
jgi:TRAP-type C4-dicarboxylate transport system permease small subunit